MRIYVTRCCPDHKGPTATSRLQLGQSAMPSIGHPSQIPAPILAEIKADLGGTQWTLGTRNKPASHRMCPVVRGLGVYQGLVHILDGLLIRQLPAFCGEKQTAFKTWYRSCSSLSPRESERAWGLGWSSQESGDGTA